MVVDSSEYSWKSVSDERTNNPSLIRKAAGGELMEYIWRGLGLGDYVLIFIAELSFAVKPHQDTLVRCMQDAWAAVRYEIPTVAAHTFYDEENQTHIIYRPARNAEEAMAWASRTVRLVSDFDNIEEFRHSISSKAIRDANGDQTFLYVMPHETASAACSVLLHTSHITFDANGLQILFTAFMKELANSLSSYPSAAYEKLEWGMEGKNILPSPYEILGETEIFDGPEYDATLKSVFSDAVTSAQYGRGLNFSPPTHYGLETKRANFTFTARDSQRFFAKVKSLGFTVNHVCHAALTLVCAEDNPVPEEMLDTAVFAYSHMVDGRPRLRPPYSNRGGYAGFCLGVSSIIIPANALIGLHLKDDISRLIYVSDLMKKEYANQKAYPSLVAIAPEQTEAMISPFKNNTNLPLPLPSSTAPWYSGDGKGELYLDPVYFDDNREKVVEILSFVTTVNKLDPASFFRVWSWRDCLTVSVDYNPHAIPEHMVEGLLNRWKQLVACLM